MSDLSLLRASLDPRFADLPQPALANLVRQIYGFEATPEDVEGLFDDIGRGLQGAAHGIGHFAQQAAPVLGNALPSVAQGAASGAAFGPWGALIGAGTGLASGLMRQSNNRTLQQIGGGIHDVGSLVSTVRGGGAGGGLGSLTSLASGGLGATSVGQTALGGMRNAGAGGGAQGGAANALIGLLSRPELLQALTAALMGAAGRQNVPVGQQSVPVSQMLAALSNVAGRAAHEAAELYASPEDTPEYASAAAEVLGIDPEDAEGRTDALLTVLALTPSLWWNRPAAAPVNVVGNPGDPFFFGNERGWTESDEVWARDSWTGEDWGGEDWCNESLIDSDEALHV